MKRRQLFFNQSRQHHWLMGKIFKSLLLVVGGGFAVGFVGWSATVRSAVVADLVLKNKLPLVPALRPRLLLFLLAGMVLLPAIWLAVAGLRRVVAAEGFTTALNRIAAFLALLMPAGLFPVLLIPGIESQRPFLLLALLAGFLLLLATLLPPLLEPKQRRRLLADFSPSLGWGMMLGMALFYALYFSLLTVTKHNALHTYGYDLGWQNQTFFNLALLRDPIVTLWGFPIHHMANHFQPLYYLLWPLYAVFPDPRTLLVLQSILVASGALPVYLLAREKLAHRGMAVALAFAYLTFPALQAANFYDFHGLTLLAPLLLWLLYFLEKERPLPFWILFVAGLMLREDVPLTMIGIGLYLWLVKKRPKAAATVIFASLAYFVFAMKMMEWLGGGANAKRYVELATEGASGFKGVLLTLVSNPLYFMQHLLFDAEKIKFLLQLLLPLAFLPLWGGRALWMAAPGLLILLLSDRPAQYSLGFQYAAHVIPFLIFLTMLAVRRLRQRRPLRSPLLIFVPLLAANLLLNQQYGLLFSKQAALPWVPRGEHERIAAAIFREIPTDARVATMARLYPHLSGRRFIFQLPQIRSAEYILADAKPGFQPLNLYDAGYLYYSAELADPVGFLKPVLAEGDFGVVRYQDGLVLLQRGADTRDNLRIARLIDVPPPDRPCPEPKPLSSEAEAFRQFLCRHRQCIILVAVRDEATRGLSPEFIRSYRALGSRIDELGYQGSYGAVISNGRVVYEQINNTGPVQFDERVTPPVRELFCKRGRFEIESGGFWIGNRASIRVNFRPRSANHRGFNAVALNGSLQVVESTYFDTNRY